MAVPQENRGRAWSPEIWERGDEREREIRRREIRRRRQMRRRAAIRRRRFIALVVVPVLLMLGNVYVHTILSRLDVRVQDLRQQQARMQAQGEKLDVRVARLSRPQRIRTLARTELGMRDPGGTDMKVYVTGKNGEDGENAQQKKDAGGGR
ncbi:septum formation initiator family protein [Rubrobacter calidifluminis]|uniref:septum formation initiator family protein n=1 Tax=Rubrobacter calidifluminis TaxID=1392640 RepID=UPI00236157DF|nr:septum formation initiator family protein [Rubrobacter calidifluminis]